MKCLRFYWSRSFNGILCTKVADHADDCGLEPMDEGGRGALKEATDRHNSPEEIAERRRLICRPATPDDMGFCAETFLRSIRSASTHVEGLSNDQVVSLLTNLIAKGWAATVCETEALLVGWIVSSEKNRLAWYYVREMFRGSGVGAYMLKHAGIDKRKQVMSPFLPNRETPRFKIAHRPFECLPL